MVGGEKVSFVQIMNNGTDVEIALSVWSRHTRRSSGVHNHISWRGSVSKYSIIGPFVIMIGNRTRRNLIVAVPVPSGIKTQGLLAPPIKRDMDIFTTIKFKYVMGLISNVGNMLNMVFKS